MKARRFIVGLIAIPALAAGMAAVRAEAQGAPTPSLDVRPFGTSRTDPDGGQWFVAQMDTSQTRTFRMRLFNTTRTAKSAKLYLADMLFNAQGTPYVSGTSIDVGTWGRFQTDRVIVPPRQGIVVSFSITVPPKADPGDHIGAVVVEEPPEGVGAIRSVVRTALRIYITLPGDARKDFQINRVKAALHSVFYPRKMTVTVDLKNTGHVMLNPSVTIDGNPASGPATLVSRSIESYVATRPVRFWGGPVRLHIVGVTSSIGLPGPSQQASVIIWVIPWHLITALLVLAGLFFLGRHLWRKRGTKVEALKSDLRRIERLITEQRIAPTQTTAQRAPDPGTAIKMAMKQARRTGDNHTAERLAAIQEGARESSDSSDDQEGARIAIFTAAKQARRAGDLDTARRLERYLAETARRLKVDAS
jgi:hypothetical protein